MWGGTKGNKTRTASSQEEERTIKKRKRKKKDSMTDGKMWCHLDQHTIIQKVHIHFPRAHTPTGLLYDKYTHTCPFLSSQLRENNSRQENNSYINILNLQGGLSVCPNLPLIKLMSQNYCSHPPFLFIYSIYPT